MTDTILYERSGHIGRLTLNIPEKHNALGQEQFEAIASCLDQVAGDSEVRVLVLTGAGDKTFCAGASLGELSEGVLSEESFQLMTTRVAELPVPTICALNGNVFGGGVELALSCDFRIGVQGSRMRVPAAAIGLCYPVSGMRRFVEVLGMQAARRLLVASEEFTDQGMLELGFLDQLVSADELAPVVNERAEHIARLAPLSVRAMKQLLVTSVEACFDLEEASRLALECVRSEDLQEGLLAKREKRAPRFSGR